MDREARLSAAARAAPLGVLTASLVLAACATAPRPRGGLADRELALTGEVVTARHIGMIGTGCAPLPPGQVRLEARPGQGVLRILNLTDRTLDFHYDVASFFGENLMFFVRFRDSSGAVLRARPPRDCGWWSPKLRDANVYYGDNWPVRRQLVIPAAGHLDIRQDQASLIYGWRDMEAAPAPAPPCEMQVRLWGYSGARTWQVITAESEWIPAPCPRERER